MQENDIDGSGKAASVGVTAPQTVADVLGVNYFADIKPVISIGCIGLKYRLVVKEVVNGVTKETPFDKRVFTSVIKARAAATSARQGETK